MFKLESLPKDKVTLEAAIPSHTPHKIPKRKARSGRNVPEGASRFNPISDDWTEIMKETINKKSKEPVVKKSSPTKKTKEHLVQKTSRTVNKITVTGRNVQEGNKRVNRISDSGTVFKKKTLKKKSKEPVIRKSSRIFKNITMRTSGRK